MGRMLSEIYAAFRSVGIPEEAAQSAAEALSADHMSTKEDISRVEKQLDSKAEKGDKALADKIEQGYKTLADKIEQVDKKLSDKIEQVDKKLSDKIEQVDKKLSDKLAHLTNKIDVHDWMLKTMFGMMASVFGVVITLLIKSFWPS